MPSSDDKSIPLEPVLPLPRLLQQLNRALGWKSADMAKALKWDAATVSRWLNGKIPRPHDSTLEYVAEMYREAGLEHISANHLMMARDFGGKLISNPYDIPEHWLRLIQSVLSFDSEFSDMMYRKWSLDFEYSAKLAWRGPRQSTEFEGVDSFDDN
jgi:hypothetical protein